MPRIGIHLVTVVGIVLPATVASADVLRRGVRERILAERIRDAGQPCPSVLSYNDWEDEEAEKLRKQELDTYRVRCSNGRVFGVGIHPMRPRAARRAAERLGGPLPEPVVKPLPWEPTGDVVD